MAALVAMLFRHGLMASEGQLHLPHFESSMPFSTRKKGAMSPPFLLTGIRLLLESRGASRRGTQVPIEDARYATDYPNA